jgi:hypothetical protein
MLHPFFFKIKNPFLGDPDSVEHVGQQAGDQKKKTEQQQKTGTETRPQMPGKLSGLNIVKKKESAQ